MHNFEVVGRLNHNGKALKDGDTLSLSAEDGKILADRGLVKAASKTAKKALDTE